MQKLKAMASPLDLPYLKPLSVAGLGRPQDLVALMQAVDNWPHKMWK